MGSEGNTLKVAKDSLFLFKPVKLRSTRKKITKE